MTAKGSSYGAMPASPAPTNVQVIAPATLAAGYTFDAMYGEFALLRFVFASGQNAHILCTFAIRSQTG